MASHRFFLEELWSPETGASLLVPLTPNDLHHAVRVARLRSGETVIIVEMQGSAWRCAVENADADDGLRVQVGERIPPKAEPHVTLVTALAKGSKTDLVVEKAVEVGVARITPLVTARGVVQLTAEKAATRRERWQRVARAAAAQSQRAFVPQVDAPVTVEEFATTISGYDAVLVAWEEAEEVPLAEAAAELAATDEIAIVVGPEGGFTPVEVETLSRAGARPITLGETILRSETASIVSAALIVYELGGLGGRSRG